MLGALAVLKRNGAVGSWFLLDRSECIIGRDVSCDVRVQLPSVALQHCRISLLSGEHAVVSSLVQENVAALDGKSLPATGEPVPLTDRAQLSVGARCFLWCDRQPSHSAPERDDRTALTSNTSRSRSAVRLSLEPDATESVVEVKSLVTVQSESPVAVAHTLSSPHSTGNSSTGSARRSSRPLPVAATSATKKTLSRSRNSLLRRVLTAGKKYDSGLFSSPKLGSPRRKLTYAEKLKHNMKPGAPRVAKALPNTPFKRLKKRNKAATAVVRSPVQDKQSAVLDSGSELLVTESSRSSSCRLPFPAAPESRPSGRVSLSTASAVGSGSQLAAVAAKSAHPLSVTQSAGCCLTARPKRVSTRHSLQSIEPGRRSAMRGDVTTPNGPTIEQAIGSSSETGLAAVPQTPSLSQSGVSGCVSTVSSAGLSQSATLPGAAAAASVAPVKCHYLDVSGLEDLFATPTLEDSPTVCRRAGSHPSEAVPTEPTSPADSVSCGRVLRKRTNQCSRASSPTLIVPGKRRKVAELTAKVHFMKAVSSDEKKESLVASSGLTSVCGETADKTSAEDEPAASLVAVDQVRSRRHVARKSVSSGSTATRAAPAVGNTGTHRPRPAAESVTVAPPRRITRSAAAMSERARELTTTTTSSSSTTSSTSSSTTTTTNSSSSSSSSDTQPVSGRRVNFDIAETEGGSLSHHSARACASGVKRAACAEASRTPVRTRSRAAGVAGAAKPAGNTRVKPPVTVPPVPVENSPAVRLTRSRSSALSRARVAAPEASPPIVTCSRNRARVPSVAADGTGSCAAGSRTTRSPPPKNLQSQEGRPSSTAAAGAVKRPQSSGSTRSVCCSPAKAAPSVVFSPRRLRRR